MDKRNQAILKEKIEKILRKHGFQQKKLVTGEVYCVSFEGSELPEACQEIAELLTAYEVQSCADGWHKEPHVRAYLYCDCADCKRGRKQIAKRMIEECLENLPQGSMIGKDAIDAVNIITDWLDKRTNERT